MVEMQKIVLTHSGAALISDLLGRKVELGTPGVISYVPKAGLPGWLVTLDDQALKNPLFKAGYWGLEEGQVEPA